jgi:hypothetical protein
MRCFLHSTSERMLYIIVQIRVYKANFIEIIIYRSKGYIQKYINDKVDKFCILGIIYYYHYYHYIIYILTRKFI